MGTSEGYCWVVHPSEIAASYPRNADEWMGDTRWEMTVYSFSNEKKWKLEKVEADSGRGEQGWEHGEKIIWSHPSPISFPCACFPPLPILFWFCTTAINRNFAASLGPGLNLCLSLAFHLFHFCFFPSSISIYFSINPQFSKDHTENITPYFSLVGSSNCSSSSQGKGITQIIWFDMKACPCLPIYSEQEDGLLYFMTWKWGSAAVHPELMPKAPPIAQSVPLTSFFGEGQAEMSRCLPRISILSAASPVCIFLCLTGARCHWHVQLHLVSQELEKRRSWQQWEHRKQSSVFLSVLKVSKKDKVFDFTALKVPKMLTMKVFATKFNPRHVFL